MSLLTARGGALVPIVDLAEISGFLKFKSFTVKIPNSNRKVFGAVGKAVGGAGGLLVSAEVGAAVGSVGGPVGAVIGGAIGGEIGTFFGTAAGDGVGEALGSDWEESMQSGDNRAEVEASAVKALQDAGLAAVEGFFASIKSAAVTPVNHRAAQLVRELERFSEVLETKVHGNGRSIPVSV